MRSIFNVGDKVVVRSARHEGYTASDYPLGFEEDMFNPKERVSIVEEVIMNDKHKDRFFYCEPFKYHISTNGVLDTCYIYSAAMFEECTNFDREKWGRYQEVPMDIIRRMWSYVDHFDNSADMRIIKNKYLLNLFDWCRTREGYDFWKYVEDEKFEKALSLLDSTPIIPEDPKPINNSKLISHYENKLQRKKSYLTGGDVPEGHTIYGRRGKASIILGSLSFSEIVRN